MADTPRVACFFHNADGFFIFIEKKECRNMNLRRKLTALALIFLCIFTVTVPLVSVATAGGALVGEGLVPPAANRVWAEPTFYQGQTSVCPCF